ncbi:DUF72 domain-containing protein [Hydrocarboniphaga sp.]|uniref:DUF72 domain-containing protein n=1 Tax=Hydrocarboniphaga sp. TaxID=2033016 RepID=UPI003D1094C8
MSLQKSGTIRVGIGGWTYAPWRGGVFYPDDLPQKNELAHASRVMTAIEINGSFYRAPTPAHFASWRDQTPEGFVFSVKAPRYTTQRRVLAEGADAVSGFVEGGVAELGTRLGPLLWQLAPSHRFDADDFAAFAALLPHKIGKQRLRHVIEARHASFHTPAFFTLLREHGLATVFTDSPDYPNFDEITADFVYLRQMCSEPQRATGYAPAALSALHRRATAWSKQGLDVFVYFINGAKERAPGAAQALLKKLAPG